MSSNDIIVRLRMLGASSFSSTATGAAGDVAAIGSASERTSRQLQDSGKHFERTGRTLHALGRGAKAFGGVLLGVGAASAVVAKKGVAFNARMEQSRVAFKGLLGSGKQADAMLRHIQKTAAKTPFDLPGLTESTQRLLGVGFAADKVIPTMKTLADAVSGTGGGASEIEGVTLALTQIQTQGRLSTEELNQMSERGIPAFKLLADEMGVTGAQLRKSIEKGAIDADTAIGALLTSMDKRWGGMAKQQSKTFNGLVSNIKDSFQIVAGIATKPLFEYLRKNVLPAISDVLGKLAKAGQADGISGLIFGLGQVEVAGRRLEPALSWMEVTWRRIRDFVAGVDWRGIFAAVSDAWSNVRDTLSGGAQSIDWESMLGSAGAVVGPFTDVLTSMLGVLEDIIALPGAPEVIGGLAALAAAGWAANAATGGLLTTFGSMAGAAFGMTQSIVTLASQVVAYRTAQLLATGATTTSTAATTASTTVTNLSGLAMLRYRASIMAARAATIVSTVATQLWAAAQWVLNAALTANPIGLVIAAVVALGAAFVIAYKKVDWFREGVNAAFKGVKNAVASALNWIRQNWPLVLSILTGPIGLAVTAIVKNWDKIVATVKRLPGRIASAATGMWDGIKDAFRAAINWIIGAWNDLELRVPKIELPGMPDIPGFGVSTPDIPLLASGGVIQRGGAAIVGERGPELVSLPAGAQVSPTIGGAGGALRVEVPVYLDRRQIALAVAEDTADRIARR
jgi:tape measure domain-containing protein